MTRRRPGAAIPILLGALLLTVAAYWPALRGEFQYDDMPAIAQNPRAKAFSLALDGFWSRYASGRPLTDLTFALDHAWSGLSTWGYHLTSLGLHLGVALAAFALARVLLRRAGVEDEAAPAVVAALFALHPLNSQAVAYLAQRSEVLSSLLYLVALQALLEAEDRWGTARGVALYALAGGTFVLALGAKPIAATLPAAFLLVQYGLPGGGAAAERPSLAAPTPVGKGAHGSRRGGEGPPPLGGLRARSLLLALPFFLGSVASSWASLRTVGGRDDAGFDIPSLGPGAYLLTQARVLTRYLSLLFWPAGQNLDYDLSLSRGLLEPPATLAAVAFLAVLAAAAAFAWRRAGPLAPSAGGRAARLSAVGVCWFFLLLAPSSSFVPLADLIEEHRPYLASFGGCLAAGGAWAWAAARFDRSRGWLLTGVVLSCLGLGAALHARAQVWSSRLTLWTDVAQKSPAKARAHMNRGHALEQAGRLEEALDEYRRTLALAAAPGERTSSQAVFRYEVLRNLGTSLLSAHRLDDAAAALTEAAALAPTDSDILCSLGMVYLDQGKLDRAEEWAARALALDPADGRAENTLGEVRLARGDVAGAWASFRRAASLDPDNAVRAFNAGMTADRLGRVADACAAYGRYLELRAQAGTADPEVGARRRELDCAPSGR